MISSVEEALLDRSDRKSSRVELAVAALGELMRRRLSTSFEDLPEFQSWSQLEQEVAIGVANGEHTGAMTARLGISASQLYRIRQSLRNSLNLSRNDSLRKRLMELLAVCLLAWPSFVGASPVTDSLARALFEQDRAAWQVARDSGQWRGLPAPYDAAFSVETERPAWSLVPDTALWQWYQSAYLALALEHGTIEGVVDLSPERAASHLLELRGSGLARATWALFIGAFVFALSAVFLNRKRRQWLTTFGGDEGQILVQGISSSEPNLDAEAAWRVFMAAPTAPKREGEHWSVLTDAEREVAACLAQHLSVEEIARQLSCTKGHVYNLRSNLRRKWNLQPDDDLVRTIHRIQAKG